MRYFLQEFDQIYNHIWRIYTVLANPSECVHEHVHKVVHRSCLIKNRPPQSPSCALMCLRVCMWRDASSSLVVLTMLASELR